MKELGGYSGRLTSLVLLLAGLLMVITLRLKPVALAQPPISNPSWSETGSLNTARSGHSATLLPDGKVLIIGGFSAGDDRLASAELYDPQAGTWSLTGSLDVPREYYTATLLGNGKVLVAGGYKCVPMRCEVTNTAELYNPGTGKWSVTGDLNVPRVGHTATMLHNGKVLVVGGAPAGVFSATNAELYDPATGQWSLTGKLSGTHFTHAATLLQDGKVLVAGGCGDDECFFEVGSAEIYDPNTATWSTTGSPNLPRYGHTLTPLPNGNVLLPGSPGRFPNNTAELYHPATGRWSYTGSLLNRRLGNTVTLLPSGQILVAAGVGYSSAIPSGRGEILKSAELYDPVIGTWHTTASLNTARSGHSATLLTDGKALIVGGADGDYIALRSAELYSATGAGTAVTVSAASYHPIGLASEGIAAAFGTGLATTTAAATALPLPTQLAGTTIQVKDAAGMERLAPLFFVSPTQVNYQIPQGTAAGAATITITSGNGIISSNVAIIHSAAPGLFTANADGQGVAAAFALRVKADGSQTYEPVAQFDTAQNKFVARPLDLGLETDRVYLILVGTGLRHRRSLSSVVASIGGAYTQVSYAGAQPDFTGLDQVNVLVPRSLAGRGEVDVLLTVEAQMANPVRINLK